MLRGYRSALCTWWAAQQRRWQQRLALCQELSPGVFAPMLLMPIRVRPRHASLARDLTTHVALRLCSAPRQLHARQPPVVLRLEEGRNRLSGDLVGLGEVEAALVGDVQEQHHGLVAGSRHCIARVLFGQRLNLARRAPAAALRKQEDVLWTVASPLPLCDVRLRKRLDRRLDCPLLIRAGAVAQDQDGGALRQVTYSRRLPPARHHAGRTRADLTPGVGVE